MKFYRCNTCDQVFVKLVDKSKQMTCCGIKTKELIENSKEDDIFEHKPIIRKIGNFVTISIDKNHPMLDVHHIEFICIETNKGFQYKKLSLNSSAKADFILAKEEVIEHVYVYCNIHQLWTVE